MEKEIKFIDLCSGIGGFHIGLKKYKCILACDINKECRESYKTNYNIDCKEDIFNLKSEDIDNFNILCAGFPCQPFSSAGLKKGLIDDRSKVYYKILDIVSNKKPEILLLENVKNILTIEKGEVFEKIINGLEDMGYNTSYAVLNTANFNLAQNRERVFIVCTNKVKYNDKKFNFDNLINKKNKKNLKDIIDLSNNEYIDKEDYMLIDKKIIKEQNSGLIFCGYLKGNIRKNGVIQNTEHLSRVHKQPNRIYHINGVNPTLRSSETSGRYYIYDNVGVRKLTVNECFAIMGFPNDYILHKKNSVNLSQIGNAVSPVLIEHINYELCNQGFI